MNSFDLVVCLALVFATVSGFNAGLLRSAVTILAYLIAMPTAVFLMSLASAGSRRHLGIALDPEFAADLRNISGHWNRAGKIHAHGAR